MTQIPDWLMEVFRCPRSGERLVLDGDRLVNAPSRTLAYAIVEGVPVLLETEAIDLAVG